MATAKFKFDLKKLSNLTNQLPKEASQALGKFTHQLSGYEERVRDFVKEFDEKSQHAREASRERLDQFTKQLRKTRTTVEKRVVSLVSEERERLQLKMNDLVEYLRRVAKVEGASGKTAVRTKRAKPTTLRRSKKAGAKKKISAKRVVKANSAGAGLPSA